MAEAKESFVKRGGDSKDRSDSRRLQTSQQVVEDVDDEEVLLAGEAKAPPRASVGWGNDDSSSSSASTPANTTESKRPGRRRKGGDSITSGSSNSISTAIDSKQRNKHFDDDDHDATDIVEIPDLEEEEREPDITLQIAEAPRNIGRSVQTLKELDRDIKFALPTGTNLGVDLSLLTSCICPEKAVQESDDNWNFDSLLNEVAQEIQKDVDEKEAIKAEAA